VSLLSKPNNAEPTTIRMRSAHTFTWRRFTRVWRDPSARTTAARTSLRDPVIRSRFAIFAVLVSCGGALPTAPISTPIPNTEAAKTAPTDPNLERAPNNGKWWTRLSIDGSGHHIEIHPDESGGVRAFVETGDGTTDGTWGTRAALVVVDAVGQETKRISAIEGIQVDTGRVALGDNGELVFAGGYQNDVGVLGTKIRDPNRPSSSIYPPMYLVALDRQGQLVWSHTFDNAAFQSIARRSDGLVVVSGTLYRSADFGGGVFGNVGAFPTFIAAFDARGKHLFSRAIDTETNRHISSVAFASDGTIELFVNWGNDVHEIDFGDGPHRGIKSPGTAMVRFDRRGNCLKSSILSILAKRVALGPSDDAVLTGETLEDEDNKRSQLVMRVDGDGNEMWRHSFPSDPLGCRCVPVAMDAHGNALTAILSPSDDEAGQWEDVVMFDRAGEEIYKRRMLGDVHISDFAFSPTGDAFIAGETMWKDIAYDGDVLPAHPQHGVFVMKIPNLAAK
jgi:hypothetical protein